MKKSTVIISVLSGLVLLGFLVVVYSLTNKPVQTDFPEVAKVAADDHLAWSTAKENVLVEYGDFQCPACKTFYQYLKEFSASESADFAIAQNITFVFRHFPLFQIHANAYPAAYAAEAASKQGKFWEMYDALFATQDEWKDLPKADEYFLKLAENLKLDLPKFKEDVASDEVKNKVEADLRSGNSFQVSSTPTFFYNGKMLTFTSFDEFKNLLQEGSKN